MKRFALLLSLCVCAFAGDTLKTQDAVGVSVIRHPAAVRSQTKGNAFSRLFHRRGRVVSNTVRIEARHPDGTVFAVRKSHNLRTNAGGDWQSAQMAGTPGAACLYIALTNDSTAPGATDTTLTSEIAASGLTRAVGSYTAVSHTQYTVGKTFTATGTVSAQKAGLFTASSSGTMCFEDAFTSITLNNNDQLVFTWTVNF